MSSIDAVIARARRPGAFSERQRFTLARSRAIQKMRHFALANPHYYVLELIQASVASGASWISMYADDLSFTLSYVGGGFPEAGLSNLFDFLFASKERQELAALRALALGVNALMLFHPRRIVIESGDGTLAGTTRMELESDADRLEIGRPDQALAGTFIRVEGMKRSKMGAELKLPIQGEGLDERGIIEQRCLCAPVPIFFNDEPIFGVASLRIPRTFGYRRSIEIDEGDLFGTLALDPLGGAPSIRLLTCGVWIESIEHELVPGSQIGGTINFDTLHKTADHARVVRDQRLEDMWLRLRPYAEMLRRGETALSRAFDVRIFGGGRIDQTQLRGFLRELGRVVVVHPGVIASSAQASVARRIAAALDAELLSASDDQIERLRVLGGREVSVIAPDLKGDEDLRVYTQAPAEEPPRPWLVSVIDAPPLAAGELARLIRGVDDDGPDEAEKAEEREDKAKPKPAVDLAYTRLELGRALGVRGDVSVKVYTPGDASGRGALEVRLHTLGREVLRTSVVSAYPGHVLIAEIPGLAPSHFAAIAGLADATAGALARHAAGALHDASRRALHGLIGAEISPCTPQAHLALAAIHRTTVIRMRRREGGVEVVLSPLEVIDGLDLLGLPILRTLDGREHPLRALPELFEAGEGVLYGVIPEVPADLEGLDRAKILDLDRESERLLIALVGEAAYVRVDARDVLAEHGDLRIRDLALGLRAYPDFPLLVEGEGLDALDEAGRAAAEEALYAGLLHLYLAAPEGDADPAAADELRRQACRHIQRYLCQALARGIAEPLGVDVVIAQDSEGRGYSLRQLLAGFAEHGRIVAHYDHGALPPPAAAIVRGEGAPAELQISPFLFRHLAALGRLVLPFDFDLAAEARGDEAGPEPAYLARIEVAEGGLRGALGIPLEAPEEPRIVLLDARLRVVFALRELAEEYGVVGALQLGVAELSEAIIEPLLAVIHQGASRALAALAARLPELPAGGRELARAIAVLLDHAGRKLSLIAAPGGAIVPSLRSEIAGQILNLPLFPGRQGLPVHASALLRELAQATRQRPGAAISGVDLVDAARLTPFQRAWLERHVHSNRIARPAGHGARPASSLAGAPAPARFDGPALCATVAGWIEALRPDPPLGAEVPGKRTAVWLAEPEAVEAPDRACTASASGGTAALVFLNPEHWQVRWALAEGEDEPRALAWLILAVYAEINALLEEVTNSHERDFQLRVADALAAGELRPLAAPAIGAG
ncbi:MAG: hypothetical protein H6711_03260 [Myxococcales bacterium]|nr:hypothetical protein [Myxococcales bacterium]